VVAPAIGLWNLWGEERMSNVVVLGAGLGGTLAAYELQEQLRPEDRLTLIGQDRLYHFVPSNPWVAVGWRNRTDIETDLGRVMQRKGIRYLTQGARGVDASARRIVLNDGETIGYDYLVIATGPELAFDEIEGLGPDGFTQSICHVDHAERAYAAFEAFCKDPGPIVVGAVQGASCFGPAYEFAFILDTELRKRRLRDRVKMTFVTPEPYIGHLGLDGVGDTKSMMESELRSRHINWITNAKVQRVTQSVVSVEEVDDSGAPRRQHELPFRYSMLLPAFRGVAAIRGLDGLVNPRGFVLIDKNQANPRYPEIYGIGVCVAIPPVGPTPVPVGTPKTGFMIESMVTATATNIGHRLRGEQPSARATWNAICLADFGDGGVAFVAQPQIPPRNVNWSAKGNWVHLAKVGFEKYFLRKMRAGKSEHFFENFVLRRMNVHKLHAAE
jgi:sulfide:quinone oxidoreductase